MKKIILILCIFSIFHAMANEDCGIEGTIQDRIDDCETKRGNFSLVTRISGMETYKDEITGKIWGDQERAVRHSPYSDSITVCREDAPTIERGYLGRSIIKWYLPDSQDFEKAINNGIAEAIQNFKSGDELWTGKTSGYTDMEGSYMNVFNTKHLWMNKTGHSKKRNYYPFRCIGYPIQ